VYFRDGARGLAACAGSARLFTVNQAVTIVDPTMNMALEIANEIGAPPALPASLTDMANRVGTMEAIEARVLTKVDCSSLEAWRASLSEAAGQMAADPSSLPDVADERERKNVLLRLWSSCMSAAKTIALGTRNGPNTEAYRTASALMLAQKAKDDPVFAAGLVAAPSFKAGRREQYSVNGVPADSLLTSVRVLEWEV
jgi:hypothetical protein